MIVVTGCQSKPVLTESDVNNEALAEVNNSGDDVDNENEEVKVISENIEDDVTAGLVYKEENNI